MPGGSRIRMATATGRDDHAADAMTVCFVTHHGSLVCFGDGQADFRHLPLGGLDHAALVLCDADAVPLRSGQHDGRPVRIRPSAPARNGLPHALGIGPCERRSSITLEWRGTHLCAGSEGGTILRSERIGAWEEFLPLDIDDLALIRAIVGGGWMRERDRRPLGNGEVRLEHDFVLAVAGLAIDLRLQPSLGGEVALRSGRATLLADGWRIEALRRFEPAVVWRHDGSETADEEIVLGLASMLAHRPLPARLLIETRIASDMLVERLPGLRGVAFEAQTPDGGRPGLLPWNRCGSAGCSGPILYLSNGVTCQAPLHAMLELLAGEDAIALLPSTWSAQPASASASASDEGGHLFANDPAEAPDGIACSAAIVGVPNVADDSGLQDLIAAISANRLAGVVRDDRIEDDLLRYVFARCGGASTRFLSRFAREGAGTNDGAVLRNFRALPPGPRIEAMRSSLDPAA